MALTPQMRQSLQLLAMPAQELNEYIEAILEKNPFLKKEFERLHTSDYTGSPLRSSLEEHITNSITGDEDPRPLLLSQLRMRDLRGKDIEVAEYLVYEIDENGYLRSDIVAETARDLGVDDEAVEDVLEILQKLDPPGVGARDVRECLQLQLERAGKKASLEYRIITDCMDELAVIDTAKMAHALKAEEKDVSEAVKNIKKLNPRPASTLLGKKEAAVIPDLIAYIKSGKIRLELNRECVPLLKLYNPYKKNADFVKDPEVKEFLKTNLKAAKQLIDNLSRREETVCRVTDFILTYQKEAVTSNSPRLKILTVNDVAKATGFHPSTISRTVARKYVQVNGRAVALKSFLSHGIKSPGGGLHSKAHIKHVIRELVEREDRTRPLSDGQITAALAKEGIAIKRRTTAKYRENLRISPSYLRRKKN